MDESSQARTRVLDAAEQLFSERGYAAVTLRDIANRLGMKQASLYYHVPNGKEELFVEVMERGLMRHHEGLRDAISGAGARWQDQLRAAADWLVSQPPMQVSRVVKSDMPEIDEKYRDRLMLHLYEALLSPLEQIFAQAQKASDFRLPYSGILVGAFLSLIEGVHNAPVADVPFDKASAVHEIIEVLIRGLEPR